MDIIKIIFIAFATFLFAACGGSGSSDDSNPNTWECVVCAGVNRLNDLYTHDQAYYEIDVYLNDKFVASDATNSGNIDDTAWLDENSWAFCNRFNLTPENRSFYFVVRKYDPLGPAEQWISDYHHADIDEDSLPINLYPVFKDMQYALIGNVQDPTSTPLGDVTMTLNGDAFDTQQTSPGGLFSLRVDNGIYVITPSKFGYDFDPPSHIVNVNYSNIYELDFTATPN